jgi:uncharacterized Zn-binding protein involved in type VI secretion
MRCLLTRPIVNGRAKIVVGDTTTHGGKVVSGSPTTVWGPEKRPIARVGDMVTCPKCKPHLFPIIEGESFFTDFTAGKQGETEFFDTEDQVKEIEFFIAG